jgi:hypothetical protein
MRKLAAIGLAGALATATVGASTSSAQAHGPGAFFWGALAVVGAVALLSHHRPFATTAYAYAPAYPVHPGTVVYGSANHVAWCQAQYPNSYNPATNTWKGRSGRVYVCNSPF